MCLESRPSRQHRAQPRNIAFAKEPSAKMADHSAAAVARESPTMGKAGDQKLANTVANSTADIAQLLDMLPDDSAAFGCASSA